MRPADNREGRSEMKNIAAAAFAKDWSAKGQVQMALLLLIVVGLVASAVLAN